MEEALRDRRFARSKVDIRAGGLDAALAYHAGTATPDILLVEVTQQNSELLENVDRLAEVCEPTTQVVVIGEDNDIALYRTLRRRGISEYLALPLERHGLVQAITDIGNQNGEAHRAPVIAFIGAKGGVGSSTIAHNTAWSLAHLFDEDVAILDLDIAFGTAALAFNVEPPQGVDAAISDGERLDDMLLDRYMPRFDEHLSLLTSPGSLDVDGDIDPDALDIVLEKVRRRTSFVILDMPHRWTQWAKRILVDADQVVITAIPDLASLQYAKNLVENLREARGGDDGVHVVLNHAGMSRKIELGTKDFRDATGSEPVATVPHDLVVFGAAANNGQMIAQTSKNHKATTVFDRLAETISRRQPPKKNRSWFSWRKGTSK